MEADSTPMRSSDGSINASEEEMSIIGVATFPCEDSPHKDAWVAMLTMSGDVDGTQKAVWAEIMSMLGHGTKNHSFATCNNDYKADTWTEPEDHIRAQGMTSSATISLNMHGGTLVPLGSNTLTAIVLSPHFQLYIHVASHENRADAMVSYVEARSRVVKGSDSVIDLSQDTSPFAAVVNGRTCAGCIDLKDGVI
jgi:hypothetical protein